MKINSIYVLLACSLVAWSCSSNSQKQKKEEVSSDSTTEVSGLTAFQMKNGVGPVKEAVKLGPFDEELAEKGAKIFETKCSACHKIGERYVGPDLQHVLNRRTPAYIMNMMMNPAGMLQKHPTAQKLLGEFMTPMANQNVSREQARAIVEYFRSVNK
jgi:mono/diheme cytochrome c family protein